MTEVRRRGGGGEDSTDNMTDKVKIIILVMKKKFPSVGRVCQTEVGRDDEANY